jgi:hypothetical protein
MLLETVINMPEYYNIIKTKICEDMSKKKKKKIKTIISEFKNTPVEAIESGVL